MKVENIMQHLIGKTYREVICGLNIDQDDGDCCGFASVDIMDGLQEFAESGEAILVRVIKIDYSDDEHEGDRVVANFVFDLGEEKGLILGYELSAGSGSGWSYGAYCSLKYGDEVIASASW